MGCSTCATKDKDGLPKGCKSNGDCLTGSCNKMNVFDWLSDYTFGAVESNSLYEISFKKGARKEFFRNEKGLPVITGDFVAVESDNGYHVGEISLSGPLVKLQMKKKGVKLLSSENYPKILREATENDMEALEKAKSKERDIMIRSRAIARSQNLDMKIGDVEVQADGKKVTFFYTAEGRVDFRELIKVYAREFYARIEMKQIGSRQEAGLIGGIGSCGRELCCSTWLTDFKTVSTGAARYQNLSINQTKLSGQCGRLKCCLNYELDTYVEALTYFPKKAEVIHTKKGKALLQKSDIFKKLMWYCYENTTKFIPLEVEQVTDLLEKQRKRIDIPDLESVAYKIEISIDTEVEREYSDLVGQISLESLEKKTKKRRNKRRKKPGPGGKR